MSIAQNLKINIEMRFTNQQYNCTKKFYHSVISVIQRFAFNIFVIQIVKASLLLAGKYTCTCGNAVNDAHVIVLGWSQMFKNLLLCDDICFFKM